MRSVRTTITAALITAATLVAFTVSNAQAASLPAPSCQLSAISQPFLAWGDSTDYELVPGGDFTGPTSWSLSGAASVATGSLALGDGAVATSPEACVNVAQPTVRFFARSDTPGTTIDVAAVFATGQGSVSIPLGTVAPTAAWEPTPTLTVERVIVPALEGGAGYVALRFTAEGGTALIDDVFVDPWRKS
jgi:hypothetical protein